MSVHVVDDVAPFFFISVFFYDFVCTIPFVFLVSTYVRDDHFLIFSRGPFSEFTSCKNR